MIESKCMGKCVLRLAEGQSEDCVLVRVDSFFGVPNLLEPDLATVLCFFCN